MERKIPHVIDIFTASPGEKRRLRQSPLSRTAPPPGSVTAADGLVTQEDENERCISRFFDYLNEDESSEGFHRSKKKKVGKENMPQKSTYERESSRESELEKGMEHIERHLSMKKTIRKKIMRDLQQAFVEDPGEFCQDPTRISPEKKQNIDIHKLTFSKSRLSKSEYNFLEMLKDQNGAATTPKDHSSKSCLSERYSKEAQRQPEAMKDDKKLSFWRIFTGKGKAKR